MGDNLKVIWAEFSTLSQAVLLHINISAFVLVQPILELKTKLQVCPVD